MPLYHLPTVSSRPLALSGPDLSVYKLTSDFNATRYSNDYYPFISSFNPLVPTFPPLPFIHSSPLCPASPFQLDCIFSIIIVLAHMCMLQFNNHKTVPVTTLVLEKGIHYKMYLASQNKILMYLTQKAMRIYTRNLKTCVHHGLQNFRNGSTLVVHNITIAC